MAAATPQASGAEQVHSHDWLGGRRDHEAEPKDKTKSAETVAPATTGSEIPWSEIDAFVRKLIAEDRGKHRAENLIHEIAAHLAKAEACDELANAAQEVTRMLVRSWENRWERERGMGESQNAGDERLPGGRS